MNEKNNVVYLPPEKAVNRVTCAMCGSSEIMTKWIMDGFDYGSGDKTVYLEVEIPVHVCADCSFEFTGHSADELQHEAVCRYLELLNPLRGGGASN